MEEEDHKNRKDVKQKKKGLRSLVRPIEPAKSPKKSKKFLKFVCLPIIISCFVYFAFKNRHVFNELKKLSMNQYQVYLHGRQNYCDENFEYHHISTALQSRIIGQETAIHKIEESLRLHDRFTALALVGGQGVGKTLTINLIQQHFQWHLNIQKYVWSLIHSKQSQLKTLLSFIDNLSECGQNGIFIDNIPLASIDIIEEFHERLQEAFDEQHFGAFIVYVFNVDGVDQSRGVRRGMGNVPMIHFRNLDKANLEKCIEIECQRLDVTLTDEQLDELMTGIDFERNGCKTVAAKVALYTRRESG